MISSEAFVLSLGLLLGGLATWAFKCLPDERWQFLASVPILKDSSGRWHGLNFTYYGLLTASALVFGVGLLIVLLGSLHVPTTVTLALILAFMLTIAVTQGWRSLSETLRADYRGGGRISAYQVMGVLAILLALSLLYLLPAEGAPTVDLPAGIEAAWHPAVVLFLQGLWALVFLLFGKSMVTGAEISFHLRHDRI